MSTYYKPKNPISIKLVKERCPEINFYQTQDAANPEGACLERDGDYIHFELNEDGDMNWFGRYGSNWDADESIIKHMANTLNIPIYSEYEEEFDELWEKEQEGG